MLKVELDVSLSEYPYLGREMVGAEQLLTEGQGLKHFLCHAGM